ncbi:MAG: hypothetical protein CVU59_03845 [Deltaproteobacteria bacterium HGW-Deltaproteobacteria-17]|nr:MAG: hypothetical protein CVU59_03845 [Deltaproteobacteria bacterium HGW-Deltaproteobacteria-17]
MNEYQKHFKELADAVSDVIIALGEIINDHRATQPNAPITTDTPQPVVPETPAPAVDEKGRVSSRQMATLRSLVAEKMSGDWPSFEATCKSRYGRAISYLTTKEASTLISELIGGQNGNHSRTAAR